MKILAIESSCDETGVSVVKDGREIISNLVISQVAKHAEYGGVVPELASRCHMECICTLTEQALTKAGESFADKLSGIDAIAVTNTPGLVGSLLVGVNYVKGIALATNKPIVPVNHINGHIAALYLTHRELTPPFICLVASGGHSHIYEVESYTRLRLLGRTLDDAAGEAYDKVARTLGYPYPGGIHIDNAAKSGNESHYKLPVPRIPGYDFSFSGIKTAVINLKHNAVQREETLVAEDVAAVFQRTVTGILADKLILAARETGHKTIAVSGGVSANSGLRKLLSERAKNEGMSLYLPELSLCGDNAAMIAAQGYYEYINGNTVGMELNALA